MPRGPPPNARPPVALGDDPNRFPESRIQITPGSNTAIARRYVVKLRNADTEITYNVGPADPYNTLHIPTPNVPTANPSGLGTIPERPEGVMQSDAAGLWVKVPVKARATQVLKHQSYLFQPQHQSTSRAPNITERMTGEVVSAIPIGLYVGDLSLVMLRRRRGADRERNEELPHWWEDNLQGSEFKTTKGFAAGSHTILFQEYAIPGNMSAAKLVLENQDLSELTGRALLDEAAVRAAQTRDLNRIRHGEMPLGLGKNLAIRRGHYEELSRGTILATQRPDMSRPESTDNPSFAKGLPLTLNYTHHGTDRHQTYIHRVPLVSNIRFNPELYQLLVEMARRHPHDLFPISELLSWALVYKDLVEANYVASIGDRLPVPSPEQFLVVIMHFYRWHEEAGLLTYIHPFTWVEVIHQTDVLASTSLMVPEGSIGQQRLMSFLNGARAIDTSIPTSTRIELYPAQMMGSGLYHPSDIPRLSRLTLAMIGLRTVQATGLPSYKPRTGFTRDIALPAWCVPQYWCAGTWAALEDPAPIGFYDPSRSESPVCMMGTTNSSPLIWHHEAMDFDSPQALPDFEDEGLPRRPVSILEFIHPDNRGTVLHVWQNSLDEMFRIGGLNRPAYIGPDGIPIMEGGPVPTQRALFTTANITSYRASMNQPVPEIPGLLAGQPLRAQRLAQPFVQIINENPVQRPFPPTQTHAPADTTVRPPLGFVSMEELGTLIAALGQIPRTMHFAWGQLINEILELPRRDVGDSQRRRMIILRQFHDVFDEHMGDLDLLEGISNALLTRPEATVRHLGPNHLRSEPSFVNWVRRILQVVLRLMGIRTGFQLIEKENLVQFWVQYQESLEALHPETVCHALAQLPHKIRGLKDSFPSCSYLPMEPLTLEDKISLRNIGIDLTYVREYTTSCTAFAPAGVAVRTLVSAGMAQTPEEVKSELLVMTRSEATALGVLDEATEAYAEAGRILE